MPRVITSPPANGLRPDGTLSGGWWHDAPESGRIVCDLCPRACSLKAGDRGFCFVRQNVGDEMVLTTYGRSTGFCIDPIEKKPLNHFYPGTSVLSFGTAGCNLGCKFCQNWDISKSREVERLSEIATPEAIAEAARRHGCRSVAFTYNDPVIWAEYAIDTARACRAAGIKTVAVTAGYITPAAREPFFRAMDAANVDLKGFTEEFYHHITYSHLQPVLDTLRWLKAETDVWFELTNLIIPRANDAPDDIGRMCDWILEACGADVPVHFTAFHPDFRMRDRPPTPPETLLQAREIALRAGIHYAYVGNVNDAANQSTYCPHCGELVIERNWYELGRYHLLGDRCRSCGGAIAGHFDDRPGDWGRKRVPIEIARHNPTSPDPKTMAREVPMTLTNISGSPPRAVRAAKLSPEQERAVFLAAAEFVAADLHGRPAHLPDPTLAGAAELPVLGAYVTLKRRGQLRACCGLLGEPRRLIDALRQAAFRTATDDHRLPPISPGELSYLDLDVNLLHNLEVMEARGRDRIEAVEVGRHGLRIQRGEAAGLLLPGVATEHAWDAETFLRQLCRKAGLPTAAWVEDDVRILTFESIEFGGPFEHEAVATPPRFSRAEIDQIRGHARETIRVLAGGGTPSFYAPGLPDGTVMGLVVTLAPKGGGEPRQLAQLALRPGLPLQATLFRLCESAASLIASGAAGPGPVRIGVTLLDDPAMHGTAHEPDLRGFDPSRRALLLVERDRSAWAFQPSSTPDEVLGAVKRQLRVLHPEGASLFSLRAASSEPQVVFSSLPKPQEAAGSRRAAVAGRFYPADPAELSKLVDGQLGASERRPESWPAAMVPHAGLVYSGRLAAAVFNRLEIPEVVIIVGPKHTRLGVDWAVAPHEAWSIPGATLPADPELARALVAAIPGLQPDAAAHAQEHAIEVELPFLARLAPTTRVVGLAVGGGDWERCRQFARGLAEVVRSLPRAPLLLISSDMNHFANDVETRRLDEIALRAMERLDPEHLLKTVNEHSISMCGVLPAVIVMEALRQLGGLKRAQRVGYATSAEVSGDTSRVVGYAGMLLS